MKEVQLFERALESIHTVSNVSVVAPSLEGQLVFVNGPLSVDEVGRAEPGAHVSHTHLDTHLCTLCAMHILCIPTYVHTYVFLKVVGLFDLFSHHLKKASVAKCPLVNSSTYVRMYIQWSLSIKHTIETHLAVLYREVSLILR